MAEIESLIAGHGRRGGLFDEDAEDFGSWVKVRLIEDDYARLTSFRGRSSLKTYLSSVIARLLVDWQNQTWGRFRTSATAYRLGEVAMQLEKLVYRNGLEPRLAFAQMLQSHSNLTEKKLEALLAELPVRTKVRFVAVQLQVELPDPKKATETVDAAHHRATEDKLKQTVNQVLRELSHEDRFAFKARYWQHLKVTEIARILEVDDKSLYRRLDRARAQIRSRVLDAGVSEKDIRQYLDWSDRDPSFELLVLSFVMTQL